MSDHPAVAILERASELAEPITKGVNDAFMRAVNPPTTSDGQVILHGTDLLAAAAALVSLAGALMNDAFKDAEFNAQNDLMDLVGKMLAGLRQPEGSEPSRLH